MSDLSRIIAERLVHKRMHESNSLNDGERVKLRHIIDTWNMIDKYGIEDWEDHDSYISMSKESYQKMLNTAKNKTYIQNLKMRESQIVCNESYVTFDAQDNELGSYDSISDVLNAIDKDRRVESISLYDEYDEEINMWSAIGFLKTYSRSSDLKEAPYDDDRYDDWQRGHRDQIEDFSGEEYDNIPFDESAPARNYKSADEEKKSYCRELISRARQTGDAELAWELVDFLYDTSLLGHAGDSPKIKKSKRVEESQVLREYASSPLYVFKYKDYKWSRTFYKVVEASGLKKAIESFMADNDKDNVKILGYAVVDPDSLKSVDDSMNEDLTLDDDPEETEQKYDSAKTSINSSKLPALFKMVKFDRGSINLDYGGGKFDNVAEYLDQTYGATNLVYDKYNRTPEHNKDVLARVRKNGGADTVTCSNVLNVIAEESERLAVLRNCKRFLKSGGTCYITVYEGNGSGEGKPSSSGYQLNRKTTDYEEEIKSVFSGATRKGKLWVCK